MKIQAFYFEEMLSTAAACLGKKNKLFHFTSPFLLYMFSPNHIYF